MKYKFARVEGQRREAQPGLSGECRFCGSTMVAKCGDIRVWHWAHRGKRTCDHWWESETEWHRAWKNQFPVEWQEVLHRAKDGEKHIADVKTAQGLVVEFQHSFLCPEERRAREAFYRQMVWVVHGLRRKWDKPNFDKAVHDGSTDFLSVINSKPLTLAVPSNRCAILREWTDSRVPVFLDFGGPVLWLLNPKSPDGLSHLTEVQRAVFIEALRTGVRYQRRAAAKVEKPAPLPKLRLTRHERYAARKSGVWLQRRL